MGGHVYILASRRNGTLYVGVTSDLARRIWQHRNGQAPSFVERYKVFRLVHTEWHDTIQEAIQREKTLKEWPRAWKIGLIEAENPEWKDLAESFNR